MVIWLLVLFIVWLWFSFLDSVIVGVGVCV